VYRAAVSALFSLVVLLTMLCEVACHVVLLFEPMKKEGREGRKEGRLFRKDV